MKVFIKSTFVLLCMDLVHGLNLFRNSHSRRVGEVELELKSASKDERLRRSTALPGTLSFQFQVGGDHVSLNLEKNRNVGVDTPVFLHRQGEAVRLGSTNHKGKDVAFYQDVTKGASIMVRRQLQMENMYELMGTYYVEDNQYSIEPIPASKETASGTFNHTISILTEHLNLKDDIINFGSYEFPLENTLNRYKRQLHVDNKYTVELLMVVDHAIYTTWYDGIVESDPVRRREKTLETIKQYYAFVINGIDVRYATIQEPDLTIDVVFAGILIFDDEQDSYLSTSNLLPGQLVESSDALETFRQWVLSNMTSLPPSDHVMLFTGFNLTYGGSTSNAGLAYLKSICNHEYFFSIVEEYFEFRVISIAAHELGHSLGARHDMDENTCLSFQLYIMTSRFKFPSKSKATNPYRFSKCSIQYFKDFIFSLKDLGLHCLKTRDSLKDVKEISGYLVQQPGEVYTADIQCQNSHGDNSYVCRDKHQGDYANICSQGLLCYNPELLKCSKILPGDGTPCAIKHWCINGTCSEDASVEKLADDCPFGDLPVTVRGNETCHDVITNSPWECYDERMRLNCCDSCFYKHSSVQGCEYGDRIFDCVKENCNDYNETTRSIDCCETCSDVPFPTRPTRTTTTIIPTTTFTLTSKVIPTTTFTSNVIKATTKGTLTNSLPETITLANDYIKPTTPKKAVVTVVTPRSVDHTTLPWPQSVTSQVDPVTTLYDVGGVTFKSNDPIAPKDLMLRQPRLNSSPDSSRSRQSVRTSTNSLIYPTSNNYRNPNWHSKPVTSSPLLGKLTTSGYVTQNEKPVRGRVPTGGTTNLKPRRDHDSTNEKSHIKGNGRRSNIVTIPNNYLNLRDRNVDMTSSAQIRPTDSVQTWLTNFLATRLTSRKRNLDERNSANERLEGESFEDGNTSGGISEEDGNSAFAWRRRVLNNQRQNMADSQPDPMVTVSSARDGDILIKLLMHLIHHQTAESISRRAFLHSSRMSEEDAESSLRDVDKAFGVLDSGRAAASEIGHDAHAYRPENILDRFNRWKNFAKSNEADKLGSEPSPTHSNRNPITFPNHEDLTAATADPKDKDLAFPAPEAPTTIGYSSVNQPIFATDDLQPEGTTRLNVDASKKATNHRFDTNLIDADDDAATNQDVDAFKDGFTGKNQNSGDSFPGRSLKSEDDIRNTILQEAITHIPIRSNPSFRPHISFRQKKHVRPHPTMRPRVPLQSDGRFPVPRNSTIRPLRIVPSVRPALRPDLASRPRPSVQFDSTNTQSLKTGVEDRARNKDWIPVMPKGSTRRKMNPVHPKTKKREGGRKEGMSDDGEMEESTDEYCSSQFLLSVYMGC